MAMILPTSVPSPSTSGNASSAVSPPSLHPVRLGADASQRTFRLLLDALSRPGRFVDLGGVAADHDVEPVFLPALALADLEVTVFVVDTPERSDTVTHLLERSTGATSAPHIGLADMVIASGPIGATHVAELRTGDARQPEAGARLIMTCTRLVPAASEAEVTVQVRGPGASSGRAFGVDGVGPGVFDALRAANLEHPAGVDTWLVDLAGRCIGIPRSSQIDVEGRS